jgi:hypothetical protein
VQHPAAEPERLRSAHAQLSIRIEESYSATLAELARQSA